MRQINFKKGRNMSLLLKDIFSKEGSLNKEMFPMTHTLNYAICKFQNIIPACIYVTYLSNFEDIFLYVI